MTTKFKITNLECEACVKLSENALKRIPGVTGATVEMETGNASIESEKPILWDEIVAALARVEKTVTQ